MKRRGNTYMRMLSGVVLILASLVISPQQAVASLRQSLDLQVPAPPTLVRVDGRLQLVYELHVTNFADDAVAITRVSVLSAGREKPSLGDFEGAELRGMIGLHRVRSEAAKPGTEDSREIRPGMRAVIYFWLALDDASAAPKAIEHLVEFDLLRSGKREHAVVKGDASAVGEMSPVVLGPPLRGGLWAALYDPTMERGHRRMVYAVQGRARIPARFAIDWVKVDKDGKFASGDQSKVASWYGYAAEVLAVADGVVASARDNIAESSSLDHSGPPNTLENASGNYIALDLGQGRFAFYEHLKPGSVAVKAGDRVRSGQVIGAVGYTGDSMGPHLHFHVSDANSTLAAEGVPWVFSGFDTVGAFESIDAFVRGDQWRALPSGASGVRSMELPTANSVVEFRPGDTGGQYSNPAPHP